MDELRVDPEELAAGGRGLETAAANIPEPLAPFTSTGTDALSTILNTLTQAKEAPLITGMPETKAEALATARKVVAAAERYEQSDQQIADDIRRATAELDAAAGGGASSTGGTGSGGGAGQFQQMMSMPMQMAQQAGQMAAQVPQGVMQGVQGGMQQVGQMVGGVGQKDDSQSAGDREQRDLAEQAADKKKDESASPDGAAAGQDKAERALDDSADTPKPGAVPDVARTKPDSGIVL
jgi:hypothetical protein